MKRYSLASRVLAAVLIPSLSVTAFASDLPMDNSAGLIPTQHAYAATRVDSPPAQGNNGSVAVTRLVAEDGQSAGVRVEVEDDSFAEAVEIDTRIGEVRGFGLRFQPILDATGTPIGLVMSNGTDTVTLPAEVDMKKLDGRQKAVLARIAKQFHASRSPARLERFQNIVRLQNVDQRQASSSSLRVGADGWLDCTWDVVNIVLDWVAVVAACGTPVVNAFACGFAITWAVADTIKNTYDMAADCQ